MMVKNLYYCKFAKMPFFIKTTKYTTFMCTHLFYGVFKPIWELWVAFAETRNIYLNYILVFNISMYVDS